MMSLIYRIIVQIVEWLLPVVAIFSKGKLKDFVGGRKNQFKQPIAKAKGKRYWFHCASLGEFEQARPVIEQLKSKDPDISIVLSFFSPSGYNQRKQYTLADKVLYLPLDTPENARKFINFIAPDIAVFVKYEIWYFHLKALKNHNIPCYLLSATFRKDQFIFSVWGKWLFEILKSYKLIFLQDRNSWMLLESKGLSNITLSGDTRYDRVKQNALLSSDNKRLKDFKGNEALLILGSSWQREEALLADYLQKAKESPFKIIIAPHDISEGHIQSILKTFETFKISRYTEQSDVQLDKILILDTIGHLSSAYLYADLAFIGGGFGKGLHNILEALSYGVPVVFGPETDRYPEAVAGMAFEVAMKIEDSEGLEGAIRRFIPEYHLNNKMRSKCIDFININSGATDKVLSEFFKS